MSEYIIIAEFEVTDGDAELLLEAGKTEAAAALANEPGCKAFEVLTDADNPRQGAFYEVYADQEAYQLHRQTCHYRAFFASIEQLRIDWKKSRYLRYSANSAEAVEQ